MKPKVVDLCCGAGLFSAGMQRAGLDIILGIDTNPVVLSSFQANFPSAVVWEMDILDLNSLPKCDILIGGIPCQPFSLANREPDHEKGIPLVARFIELAKKSKVKYWIMEEVPPVLEYVKDLMPRVEIWECSKFGAKNLRPRLFGGSFPDPVPVKAPCSDPAPTVLATDNSLSIEEMKDLQGIPGWMAFFGNDSEKRMQIGNGVPLEVGEAIGLGIVLELQGRTVTGHQAWHKTVACYYREKGGSRIYRSVQGFRYCTVCKAVMSCTSKHGIPTEENLGTPRSRTGGIPKSISEGVTAPGKEGIPTMPAEGTPPPELTGTPVLSAGEGIPSPDLRNKEKKPKMEEKE